jgi:type III secretory pathway component EscT
MGFMFLLACSASIAFFLRQGGFDFVVGSLYKYLFITPLTPLILKRGKLGGDETRPYE